ncbi:NAD(P)-binding protein [Gymnopus androsaceus JB14]|uniref:enoyl-[acyl-carrier-protein] reductase n=1 Tax=Gymnopus androsaceus JB14 TaxID=1447944 RepID=A0A6A4HST4_9AGAR|nr:NAD(P)-binding protein [Gymnopus androsaceus JB14]
MANRCIIYQQNGDPTQVLSAITFPKLPSPSPNTVNLKFLLAPLNPADVNTIEGDEPVFVGGNEGLGQVVEVGDGVEGLEKGDWVVMDKPQLGTWSTSRNVSFKDVIRLPSAGLTEAHGATMTVNPTTAYNMLSNFANLHQGDWVIQNGANSAVGQLVVQIAKERGLNTINFVRSRDDMEPLVKHLEGLGATKVLTYDDLEDRSLRGKIKEWTGGKDIRLALNCVGGEPTTAMAKLLGQDSHLVSYGAMSKKPLSLPTSLHIFKNLTSHGFWQTNWTKTHSRAEKEELIVKLAEMMKEKKIKAPEHTIETDEEATTKIRDVFAKVAQGKFGKKVLLKLEDVSA